MARARRISRLNAFVIVGVTLLVLGMFGLFWGVISDDADTVASNAGIVSGAVLVVLVGGGLLWWQRR